MSDDWDVVGPAGMGAHDYAAASAAAEAGAVARAARTELAELAADVDRLSAITQALWSLLRTEHGYDDATLRRKVAEFGRAARAKQAEGAEIPPCVSCGRPVSRRHPRCLYCGAETPMDLFAR